MYKKFVTTILIVAILTAGLLAQDSKKEQLSFKATAYCGVGKGCKYGGFTASGLKVRRGIIAADPKILPLGSVVKIISPETYAGIYLVADTGGLIKRKILDVWVPSYREAINFGRRDVILEILFKGNNKRLTEEDYETIISLFEGDAYVYCEDGEGN